jgi:hypothetical protein
MGVLAYYSMMRAKAFLFHPFSRFEPQMAMKKYAPGLCTTLLPASNLPQKHLKTPEPPAGLLPGGSLLSHAVAKKFEP